MTKLSTNSGAASVARSHADLNKGAASSSLEQLPDGWWLILKNPDTTLSNDSIELFSRYWTSRENS